jgi:hypothetical protein
MRDSLRARGKRNQQQKNFIQEVGLAGKQNASQDGRVLFLLPTKRKIKKPEE